MSDVPCHLRPPRYDHTPDHTPTQLGEKGYCKVCLEYDYVAEVSGVNLSGPGGFLRFEPRWTPCSSALEIEARRRRAGMLASKDANAPTPADDTSLAAPRVADPTIWFHAERQYSIDGKTPLNVSDEFDYILQAFLQSQGAMTTRELIAKSGVTNVSRAMRALADWNDGCFKAAIRIPSGKAKGGYFIRVQRMPESPVGNP